MKHYDCLLTRLYDRRKHDPNYVSNLESQNELLKEEIRRLRNFSPSSVQHKHTIDIISDKQTEDGTQERSSGSRKGDSMPPTPNQLSDKSAIQDISALTWQLKIGDNGETTFLGPSGNFCFSTANADPSIQAPSQADINVYDIPVLKRQMLSLFSVFINPVHQLIDEETLQALEQDTLNESDFLQSAILASGSLYSDDPRIRAYGNVLASNAEATSMEICREYPTVRTVQGLAIMCWREMGLGNKNMAWMYNCKLLLQIFRMGTSI